MASLIDSLAETLEQENNEYRKLVALSTKKTDVIVKSDLEGLQRITEEEQQIVQVITELETTRTETMKSIAKILNTDVQGLKLEKLVSLLGKTPDEQKKLAHIHDELKGTLKEMRFVNERNEDLLNSAIEMVNFNMTLIQSMKKAPETANYNRGAYSTGSAIGIERSGFDAKQ